MPGDNDNNLGGRGNRRRIPIYRRNQPPGGLAQRRNAAARIFDNLYGRLLNQNKNGAGILGDDDIVEMDLLDEGGALGGMVVDHIEEEEEDDNEDEDEDENEDDYGAQDEEDEDVPPEEENKSKSSGSDSQPEDDYGQENDDADNNEENEDAQKKIERSSSSSSSSSQESPDSDKFDYGLGAV